jgi:hypothetical protein
MKKDAPIHDAGEDKGMRVGVEIVQQGVGRGDLGDRDELPRGKEPCSSAGKKPVAYRRSVHCLAPWQRRSPPSKT